VRIWGGGVTIKSCVWGGAGKEVLEGKKLRSMTGGVEELKGITQSPQQDYTDKKMREEQGT